MNKSMCVQRILDATWPATIVRNTSCKTCFDFIVMFKCDKKQAS